MVRILLVCSAGMSTSFMVNKMKDSAKEKGIEAEIWAVAEAEAADNIGESGHYDVRAKGPFPRRKNEGAGGR